MQPEGDELAPQADDEAPDTGVPEAASLFSDAVPSSGAAPSGGAASSSGSGSAASSGDFAPSGDAVEARSNGHGAAAGGSAGGTGGGATYRSNNGGTSAAALAALWNDSDRQRIRGRWQELQLRFIDDPHLVAGEAERLVQEAVTALTASLDARRGQLHQQRAARGLDTENLRASLRDYREFLDRILGL